MGQRNDGTMLGALLMGIAVIGGVALLTRSTKRTPPPEPKEPPEPKGPIMESVEKRVSAWVGSTLK
jgi:hypothetical protein